MSVFVLTQFRDEAHQMPAFFDHHRPCVDGFIWVDDGSIGLKSMGYEGIGLIRTERLPTLKNITTNRLHLLCEAWRRAPDRNACWVLCLDADERCDLRFLKTLRDYMSSDRLYALHVRDPWDCIGRYRVDGVWGQKTKTVFFRLRDLPDRYYPHGALHAPWPPPDRQESPTLLPYNVYHLGSLTREMRVARSRKHNDADPTKAYQAIGYDYLCDDTGAVFEEVPAGSL